MPPVRVDNAFPAIISRDEFERVSAILGSKAPAKIHPRRAASPYLLSGIVRCETCGKALTAHEAKSGQFTYYVCHSLLKRGQGACDTPRLNSKRFERMIIDSIRENILTESNIRELVKLVNEELDSVIREQREKAEAVDEELNEIRRRLDRLWQAVETTDLEINDILPRIREHKERQEKLEIAADEARAILAVQMQGLGDEETIAAYVKEMSDFLMESELTETRAFIRSFVKEIGVVPGKATIRYTIPMPKDSPIKGRDAQEIALSAPVLSTVTHGGACENRTRHNHSNPPASTRPGPSAFFLPMWMCCAHGRALPEGGWRFFVPPRSQRPTAAVGEVTHSLRPAWGLWFPAPHGCGAPAARTIHSDNPRTSTRGGVVYSSPWRPVSASPSETKPAMSWGTAESNPTTSMAPASSGSAMLNPLETMPTTTSLAGMPISCRYCRSASIGWTLPYQVSLSVRMTKQSTGSFRSRASSIGRAQSVRPQSSS